MTTFRTGNPVPSTAVRDLYDNAENFDTAVNSAALTWEDRLGKIRKSWSGVEKDALDFIEDGEDAIARITSFTYRGDWVAGTSYQSKDVVRYDGMEFITMRDHVASPSFENDLNAGIWVPYQGIARAELADKAGSDLVGFAQDNNVATPRTMREKAREYMSAADYGAVGNGVTDDTAAFARLESVFTGRDVDLLGKTYLVGAAPPANKYFNGFFLIGGITFPAANQRLFRYWDRPLRDSGGGAGGLAIGTNAAKNVPDYSDGNPSQGFIAIGRDALGAATRARSCIAIGNGAMAWGNPGFSNMAIGDFVLSYVEGTSSAASVLTGSRNIGIGTLAGHFITSGFLNVMLGRNAGSCITTAQSNTALGYRAIGGGYAPVGLSGRIENHTPVTFGEMTAVGEVALQFSNGRQNTAMGRGAGQYLKAGGFNVIMGALAGQGLDRELSYDNKVLSMGNTAATYSQSGTVITVQATGSGAVAGNKVLIAFTSGELSTTTSGDAQYLTVASVIGSNTFTLNSPVSTTASGDATIQQVETAVTRNPSSTNTIVGTAAMFSAIQAQGCTAMGWQAGFTSSGDGNTLIGQRSGYNLLTGTNNTFIGINAGRNVNITAYSNCSALGADATVNGNNQVQLGNTLTTPYAYAALQLRSDIRDKSDVRPTSLDEDFIMGLEPIEWRWDMREDYEETYEEQVAIEEDGTPIFETKYRTLPKDGSKKRTRFHQGFSAQQVKELCDRLGIDFAGLQHYEVNGGEDIWSIGYEEFIGPIVSMLQKLSKRQDEIEARLAKLEA